MMQVGSGRPRRPATRSSKARDAMAATAMPARAGSAQERNRTSGPTPAGSPMVMAMGGMGPTLAMARMGQAGAGIAVLGRHSAGASARS